MAPYKITAEWIDFNPLLERDIFRVTAYSSNDEVIFERECVASKLPDVVRELVEAD